MGGSEGLAGNHCLGVWVEHADHRAYYEKRVLSGMKLA
jgi:hypothetical protein